MPHALLLSPDDQAVSAITGVLEEMSVTCERPLDGVSAAQKLNAHSFDLVLVDCENLPAAKLIFDVCRRGKNGHNPVPIAIVDGRAGLPTAFRLGAELILTKPVAKDQARSTIRTAVGRVRKDAPTKESLPELPANAPTTGDGLSSADVSEEHAQTAAAAAVSSQLTSFAEPAPRFVRAHAPNAVSGSVPSAMLSAAAAPAMKMQTAVDEDEIGVPAATAKLDLKSAHRSPSPVPKPPADQGASESSKPAHPTKFSDDPVMAELERTELEASQGKGSQPENANREKASADLQPGEFHAPVFSSYQQGQQKRRSPLIALLMLVLAGAGFYAAWTYQPGFRAIAELQIDRLLALAGKGLPPAPAQNPAQPAAQIAVPAPVPNPATGSATISAPAPTAAAAPVQPPVTASTAAAPPPSNASTTVAPAPVAASLETSKPHEAKKDVAATSPSDAPLLGENTAVILSSKGAEKRLTHSVPAQYPAEARSGEAQGQGTIVLKEVVDETGKVEGVRLVEGDAALANAAIKAVKQWRYRPYVRDGKALPFQTVVIIDFQRP